ncbi:MAG: FtsX-like permease family protein [Clostridiales bacterium]|nr:FtsX-like permease family protein [Clostridiales bacterium]
MRNGFYFRLALSNVRRNKLTYVPYLVATAVMSGVFLLIAGLLFSKGMTNTPSGDTARMLFAFGLVVYALFTFFFMFYINNFLIKRRKKEFGLYGILGLDKRHVGRVLVWENLFVIGGGIAAGIAIALVFGRLLFLVLMKLIHAVPGSSFSIPPVAYGLMLGLFFFVFLVTSTINVIRVHTANPIALLASEKRGEKDKKGLVPLALLGLALLCGAYYYAWTTEIPGIALGIFFPLAIVVIIATYLLFLCGSIVVLRLLRMRKSLYYRPDHFVTISGMFHRMRQNARGLATICILSTMLVVTVSGTLSLYLGREEMTRGMYPFDAQVYVPKSASQEQIVAYDEALRRIAAEHHVVLSADENKLVTKLPEGEQFRRNNFIWEDSAFVDVPMLIFYDGSFRFDVAGSEDDCLAFIQAVRDRYAESFAETPNLIVSDIYTAREEGYGFYGGLLFLGAFFAVLFLAVAVLILYFKQVTEGYEDKARFDILQQVGMDDHQVRKTINAQVLWVFFLPLAATALHMLFASKIMARMLKTFMLYDWGLVLACIGGTLVAFSALYFLIYRVTARTYYRIVRR